MNRSLDSYFKYLILIAMIYMSIDLASMVFAYKEIRIGTAAFIASSIIFPVTYSIMDIVAEVYGYKIAKTVILYSFICDFIFSATVLLISNIPSPTKLETSAYLIVLAPLMRAVFAQAIGVLSGALINIHLISKWKAYMHGEFFWLRSIGASAIGEAVMLTVSVFISLTGILPTHTLTGLIAYTYIYKIIFAIIAAPMVCIITAYLKMNIAIIDQPEHAFSQKHLEFAN